MEQEATLLSKTIRFWRRNFVSIAVPTFVLTAIFLDYRRTQKYKRRKAPEGASLRRKDIYDKHGPVSSSIFSTCIAMASQLTYYSQSKKEMGLRRLRADHYKTLALIMVPVSAMLFGAYQQFLWDQSATLYRNKSKMFGGKQLPEGEVAWR